MAEGILYFAIKTIGRSTVNGRKPCTLLDAARHNLREIQAELGADGHIDPRRTGDNIVMSGPAAAAEVQALADRLLALVDASKLKRDHVQAIEIVFSLPPGATVEPLVYFTRCLEWLREAVPLPVLLATAHRDEAAPHAHVLLLPVKDGVHVGGALNTRPNLKQLRDSFFREVAGPAGLKREGAKVRGLVKQWAVAAVLARCEAMGLPAAMGPLWTDYRASIERDPTPRLLALGIDISTIRPDKARPIGLEARAIGLQKEEQKHQALSCVGLLHQTTLASAQKAPPATVAEPVNQSQAIHTLAALWATVGCRSSWTAPTKAERMMRAREAQQRAIDRHRLKPATLAPVVDHCQDHDGLTRERDEHAHDLSAWND